MISRLTRMSSVAALSMTLLGQTAFAQSFDNKKFFNELSSRGVSVSKVDPDRFFEEMRLTGASAQNRLDPDKFFAELQARGASMPAGFNSRAFFDDLAARGASAPDIVDPRK